ncbi:glycosyltransferase family 4 protein [Bartonella sp. LJL80]
MRVIIVTDAWHPQVNGVVRTLENLVAGLAERDVSVTIISPEDYRSLPCPTYPEIRLALVSPFALAKRMEALQADAVHIATEGPLGFWARWICKRKGWRFTTSFHTRFPEYLSERLPVPLGLTYAWLRRFHNAAAMTLVPTQSIETILKERGFQHLTVWTRGVDRAIFHPQPQIDLGLPKPIFLSVGRLAIEKNIEAFLKLDLPGTKLIVGDGPDKSRLEAMAPDAVFLGKKQGKELAEIYAGSDVFVFPSKTDTFGLVMLEAMASGLPVAGYPVPGASDIIAVNGAGVLSEDLQYAAMAALGKGRIDPDKALENFTWGRCVDIFRHTLVSKDRKGKHKPSYAA